MIDTTQNRQRVLSTLSHRRPDKVPYNLLFTKSAHEKMSKFYGDSDFEAKLGNCFTTIQGRPKHLWQEIEPDILRDDFGTIWDRTQDKDIGVVANKLITSENVNSFQFPDPNDPARYKLFKAGIQNNCGFTVVNLGMSLFERVWVMAGMENILMAMIADKTFVHTLFDRILEFNLKSIENFCKFDVDAILFGDDWGTQRGLIMGYELWREFIKPRIAQMYSLVKSKKKFVFIHCCGQVQELFPELIECGLDVFNPFQPEVMDVFEIKRQYSGRLCFYGGISTQSLLPFGTPIEVRDAVQQLISLGQNGSLFVAPAHAIPADAKPENIAAMIEVLQNQQV
ncbi:MAG: uroporphyrinogen decarboxylase family protein [Sedimentisphaerales bacterium]